MENKMTSLHYVILKSLSMMQGERTMNGIIHILRGKRSAQTIQDISLFDMDRMAAILKSESTIELGDGVKVLYNNQLFKETQNKVVFLSDRGSKELEKLSKRYSIPDAFHGLKYEWNQSSLLFWGKLSLLIQTISYMKEKKSSFLPVSNERDVQRNIKEMLKKYHKNIYKLGGQLYSEIEIILDKKPEKEATLFVHRLTSTFRTGRTFDQLSYMYDHDRLYTSIVFRSILHDMITQVSASSDRFPVLFSLLAENNREPIITNTSAVTKKLFDDGYSIDQIGKQRNLKRSTIEDHIVELSIHDADFHVDDFITFKQLQEIKEQINHLNTRKLKIIKDALGDRYTYFQIRLAISSQKGEGKI